jgi:predicted GTPase
LPIYHPGFELTEKTAKDILSTFTQYITKAMNSGYKDDEAIHLRIEILNNKTIPYQETIQLAVAGDTGAGKSALLNAILGVVNLNIEVRRYSK